MAEPYDNWHKSRPKPDEEKCKEHGKVPSKDHGKGKRWVARWRDPSGKQEDKYFDRLEEARKHLNKISTSIDTGTYIPPSNGETKFKVIAKAWVDNRKHKSPRTYAQYESRVDNHIIAPLGEIPIGKIKPSTVVSWINGRREIGLDDTYIGLILQHLSAMLETAVEDEVIGKNPCRSRTVKDVKPKRGKKSATDVPISAAQSDALRENLPDRYKAVVDVGRGFGMRQGEIFGFSPDDIDWQAKEIHLVRQIAFDRGRMVFAPPKCSDNEEERDRYIPASDEVLFRLVAHMTAYPPIEVTLPWKTADGEPRTVLLFFTSREGKPLNKNYFNWVWKAAAEAAGIIKAINDKPVGKGRLWEECRDRMMHALRHLYASERVAEGMDVYTLALRMGHADAGYTLRKYIHRVAKDHSAERAQIDRTLRGS